MSNEVTISGNFEDRLKARIKDSFGDLLTDEDLSKIVHRGVEDIFFNSHVVREGYREKTIPPLIHEVLKPLISDLVREEVKKYIQEHSSEVLPLIQDLVQKGMGDAFLNSLTWIFKDSLGNLERDITNRITNQG